VPPLSSDASPRGFERWLLSGMFRHVGIEAIRLRGNARGKKRRCSLPLRGVWRYHPKPLRNTPCLRANQRRLPIVPFAQQLDTPFRQLIRSGLDMLRHIGTIMSINQGPITA
jgi:hypothetical protein